MTVSSALSNALSGLTAATRAAETVSSNLANTLTEGYGRREVDLLARSDGTAGGVRVIGVNRIISEGVISDRRLADAELSNSSAVADFHVNLESLLGNPEDGHSLSAQISSFEDSLISAASRPESQERLQLVSYRAADVSSTFNSASDGIQHMREKADTNIGTMVDRLNELLQQAKDLNQKIIGVSNQGKSTASLQDHRQQVIDGIAELVSVRQVPRNHGAVALYTTGGAILLDGSAAELAFTTTNVIMPHMTEDAGLLSGLTINDVPVRTGSDNGVLRGGAISAQFEIRDELAVKAQDRLDSVARDFIERFQDPATDPTLAIGDAGMFTDSGLAFDSADEVGISGRLQLNTLVDTNGANEIWRLRDGLNATSAGNLGNSTLLQSLSGALTRTKVPASGGFGGGALTAHSMTSNFLSKTAGDRLNSDQTVTYATTRQSNLRTLELQDGVDSDQELQKLLIIEQTYAANARVIQTVDEMMQALLRI
jgi:flagellar hook-associated protein 1 FlgK